MRGPRFLVLRELSGVAALFRGLRSRLVPRTMSQNIVDFGAPEGRGKSLGYQRIFQFFSDQITHLNTMGIFAIGKPPYAQSVQSIMTKFKLGPANGNLVKSSTYTSTAASRQRRRFNI
jgi:hypothetical protein